MLWHRRKDRIEKARKKKEEKRGKRFLVSHFIRFIVKEKEGKKKEKERKRKRKDRERKERLFCCDLYSVASLTLKRRKFPKPISSSARGFI